MEQLRDEGIDVPIFDGSQEYLYWVGCSGALVERNMPITQSVVRLLIEAGVSFGVLGQQETCTGDPARRLGSEFLYATLAETNVATMNEIGVRRVITACPHCFNTFKNEYPDFDGQWEVTHHSGVPPAAAGARQAAAEEDGRPDDHVPRLVLPGPGQRHHGRASRRAGADSRGRSWWRCRAAARRACAAARAAGNMWLEESGTRVNHLRHGGGGEHGREHRGDGLPLLHPDVRGRHPRRSAGRGVALDPGVRHRGVA